MKTIYGVYDQVAKMIALIEPEKVMALRASVELQKRFDFLVEKFKKSEIDQEEKDELDHFIVLERLFRIAKIRSEK